MIAPHNVLAAGRDTGMEVQAANRREHHLLANSTPEPDCLLDDFLIIRDELRAAIGADRTDELLAGFVTRLRQVIELNNLEYKGERAITGMLDHFARAQHRDTPKDEFGIRGLVRALRPALRILDDKAEQPLRDVVTAVLEINRVVHEVSRDALASDALRHELGGRMHNVLLQQWPWNETP